jgi:hypothetical protein
VPLARSRYVVRRNRALRGSFGSFAPCGQGEPFLDVLVFDGEPRTNQSVREDGGTRRNPLVGHGRNILTGPWRVCDAGARRRSRRWAGEVAGDDLRLGRRNAGACFNVELRRRGSNEASVLEEPFAYLRTRCGGHAGLAEPSEFLSSHLPALASRGLRRNLLASASSARLPT